MYTLSKFANNNVGTKTLNKIIIPPIVGVPFFCCSPSNPRSLTVSPNCFFCKKVISFFPKTVVIIKEKIEKNTESNYPNQIISIAADYCKNQSKSKNNKKLKIIYTEVLNIKKGKEVGSVIVSKPKYLFI